MNCHICDHSELNEDDVTCPKCGSDLEIFHHIEEVHKVETFQKKAMLVLTGLLGVVMVSWGSVSLFSGSSAPDTETATAVEAPADPASVDPLNQDPNSITNAAKPTDEFIAENNAEVKPEVKEDNDLFPEVVKPEAKKEVVTPEVKKEVVKPEIKKEAVKPEAKVEAKVKAEAKKPAVKEVKKADGGVIIHKVRKGDSFWKISKKYFGNGNHAKQIAADNGLNPKKDIPLGTKLKINK